MLPIESCSKDNDRMKNQTRPTTLLCLLLGALFLSVPDTYRAATAQGKAKAPAKKAAATKGSVKRDAQRSQAAAEEVDGRRRVKATAKAASDEVAKAELGDLVKQNLPAAERIARLEAFVAAHSNVSTSRTRALELLTSARAALGDEKLRAGDALGGIALFRQAVAEAPLGAPEKNADRAAAATGDATQDAASTAADAASGTTADTAERSDKLFAGVIAQLPANLYVLGHEDEAFDLARRIEGRVKDNPERLLALAAFYFGVERPDEAARVAEEAARLAPDNARAHQALGEAYRFALRLDKAAEEYARALELDPRAAGVRRGLADLRRATGKPDEALALYREQLATDTQDASARAGVVLSLFDAGRRDEAERELQAALAAAGDNNNLPLLVGAAYWYAAHNEAGRAREFAEKALALEPRYKWVWARITFARVLMLEHRALDAERALRLARLIGRFPTLDYELASALAAAGLYQEAAEELAHTFALKNGEIEARLAGRTPARAASFTELLAPERRAGIFQFDGADTDANARMLKALLAFHLAVRTGGATLDAANEREAVAAASEFVAGDDELRTFRQLYVAGRLLQRGTAFREVIERTDAAMGGVEAALGTPVATIATLADELYDLRARAIAAGTTPNIPDVPRNVLSNVLRGRIEDLAGWALYLQSKSPEAVVRLKRATSVLPEGSPWWRAAQWHLGAALDATGNQREALAAYVRSYQSSPDAARRIIIETLYQKINGSLDGLDKLLAAPPSSAARAATGLSASGISDTSAAPPASTEVSVEGSSRSPTQTIAPQTATGIPSQASPPLPAPLRSDANRPEAERAAASPTVAPTDVAQADVAPVVAASPAPAAQAGTAPTAAAAAQSAPTTTPPDSKPAPGSPSETTAVTSAAAAPEPKVAEKLHKGGCTLAVSETAITLNRNGGSVVVTVSVNNSADVSKISAATRNWADIIILAEPRNAADDNSAARYTITSVSQKTGTYTVTFTSPCGKREVAVEVK